MDYKTNNWSKYTTFDPAVSERIHFEKAIATSLVTRSGFPATGEAPCDAPIDANNDLIHARWCREVGRNLRVA